MVLNIIVLLQIICLSEIGVHGKDHQTWVWPKTFKDEGRPLIEMNCGAYLETDDWLSWYNSTYHVLTTYQQKHDGYGSLKLLWPLALWQEGKVAYCEKQTSDGKKHKGDETPINFDRVIERSDDNWGPKVWPEELTENESGFIEFECWAYISRSEQLAWYQQKGPYYTRNSRKYMLAVVEQKEDYGFVRVKLRKTLVPSDNGTNIFCETGNGGKKKTSKRVITLNFQKQVQPLPKPYITMEPSAGVVFFDEYDELEFTCGGSGPVDGRRFGWYLKDEHRVTKPPLQAFYKSTNVSRLVLSVDVFDHEKQLYCALDFTNVKLGITDDELIKSKAITLLHRARCDKEDLPKVVPEKFEDDGKPYIMFTCYSFLKRGEVLAWYRQTKGSNKEEDELLRLTQFQEPGLEGQWTVLELNKTLEPTDKDSNIYCVKQDLLADGSLSSTSIWKHKKIHLKSKKSDVRSLGPVFITSEPNTTNVAFVVNSTLRFTCGGSSPIDNRAYTWFKIDSEAHLTVPDTQKYDASTNLNVLELFLDETNHMNHLYCAQGFLSHLQYENSSIRYKFYGELARTEKVTLILREKEAELAPNSNPEDRGHSTLLAATIPLSLLALAAVAVALWALRGRRGCRGRHVARTPSRAPLAPEVPAPVPPAPSQCADDCGDYINICRGVVTKSPPETQSSPEVTYAELDLPRTAPRHAPPPPPADHTLYAEVVVGVRDR